MIKNMLRCPLLWLCCLAVFLLPLAAHTQAPRQQKAGQLLDASTGQPIKSATVRNVMSGQSTLTSSRGQFGLAVGKGNILALSATGFYSDTLTMTDSILALPTISIQLRPMAATLPGATVTSKLSAYQLDSLERRRDFLATVGEVRIPVVSRANDLGFGVGINLDRFGKREKRKREARTLFDITEEDAYINYRWNDSLVQRYTRLQGDSLTQFMQAYRPTWDWLRSHTRDEDMLYYINKSLKKYFRRPD